MSVRNRRSKNLVMDVRSRSAIRLWTAVCLSAGLLSACFNNNNNNSKNNAAPVFTSADTISVVEGATATGYTAAATDANAADVLTFSVSGGADQAHFTIDGATGVLSFAMAPEFNNPADADGDNVYEVQLTVDDGRSGTDTLDLTVTVTGSNQDPVFTSANAITVTEGTTATGYTATASDANAGDTLSFSVSGGADQAQFSIDAMSGVLSFVMAPDFAAPADANGDNDYEAQLTVDDGNSGTDTLDLVVTVTEQGNLSVQVTFPTPNANLGGDATQTTVTGNIVDSTGAPINLADIDYVDVNGQMAALDQVNPGRWTVQVPASTGTNTLAVELGLTDGSTVSSSQQLQNSTVYLGFGKFAVDSANDRILVVDGGSDALIAIDFLTGDGSPVSGDGVGAGTDFNSPRDAALDSANNRALVVDWQRDALVAVDLASGDRTDLSNAGSGTGAGIVLDGPQAVALDVANNRALVVATIDSVLVAVDLATGDRTALSGGGAGAGPAFDNPRDVDVDAANNRALVADSGLDAVVAVDLTSGDRTVLSDAMTGTGDAFSVPESLSLDAANNRVLVAELTGLLVGVDLTTGNRTLVAETRTAFGVNGTRLAGVGTDSVNSRAILTDSTVDAIYAIDFATGDRTVLSDSGVGAGDDGTNLWGVRGIALDRARDRLVLTNSQSQALLAVDLSSGDRSFISSASIGSGPIFTFPGRLVVDGGNNRAVLPDGNVNGLFAVDLDSGDRTILSNGIGAGPAFDFAQDVDVDAAGEGAIVLDSSLGLFDVDLVTGDRSIISDAMTGSGPLWAFPDGVEVDLAGGVAYVVDDGDTALYTASLATGDRTIFSDNAGIGTGPSISFPNDLKLDIADNRALIVNRGAGPNLMAVDLTSGDRTILSGAGVGSGQSFARA
jgi:hypothetical protein